MVPRAMTESEIREFLSHGTRTERTISEIDVAGY
jgi:hypothetical protein